MRLRAALLASAALALPAIAHAAAPPQRVAEMYGSAKKAASGPCAGVVLETRLDGGSPSCQNGAVVPAGASTPGLTHSGAVITGTGANGMTADDPAAGVVLDFASGALRLTSNGCICAEPAATNLVLDSTDLTDVAHGRTNSNATVTNSAITSPDSGNKIRMGKLLATGNFATSFNTMTVVAGNSYTMSEYLASGNVITATLFPNASGGAVNCNDTVDLSAGTITPSAPYTGGGFMGCNPSIKLIGTVGGHVIYRVRETITIPAGTTSVQVPWVAPGGFVANNTQFVYFGGEQFEAVNTTLEATSFVPTTSAAVTRSADGLTQACAFCTAPQFATLYYGTSNTGNPTLAGASYDLDASISGGTTLPVTKFLVTNLEPVPPFAAALGFNTVTLNLTSFSAANTDFSISSPPAGKALYPYGYFTLPASNTAASFNYAMNAANGQVTITAMAAGGIQTTDDCVPLDGNAGVTAGSCLTSQISTAITTTTTVAITGGTTTNFTVASCTNVRLPLLIYDDTAAHVFVGAVGSCSGGVLTFPEAGGDSSPAVAAASVTNGHTLGFYGGNGVYQCKLGAGGSNCSQSISTTAGTIPANYIKADGSLIVTASGNTNLNFGAAMTTATQNGAGAFRGTFYGGGGYFEANVKLLLPGLPLLNAGAWPAPFWTGSQAHQVTNIPGVAWYGQAPPYGHNPECDWEDFTGAYANTALRFGLTCHDHFGNPANSDLQFTFTGSAAIDTNYHKLGLLWKPAALPASDGSMCWYFDRVLLGSCATWHPDISVSQTAGAGWVATATSITLSAPCNSQIATGETAYNFTRSTTIAAVTSCVGSTLNLAAGAANLGNNGDVIQIGKTPPGSGAWANISSLDVDRINFILGSSLMSPMQYSGLKFWQADTSGNATN